MQKQQESTGPAMSDTIRELRKESLFWHHDHPPETALHRDNAPDLLGRALVHRPATQQLEGVKASLRQADNIYRMAKAHKDERHLEDSAMRLRDTLEVKHHGNCFKALQIIRENDYQRAFAEARHWHLQVKYREGMVAQESGGAPPAHGQPEPDRRLPREPGEDDLAF